LRSRGFRDILIARFTFPAAKTEFTCVLVNQQIDYERDQELEKEFAGQSGMAKKQIVIDSDYNVSYPGNELGDDSKNSFDKLFLKWSNGEVDAIVMTDDFLEYCVSVGGEFYDAGKFRTGDLSVCRMDGASGIDLTECKTKLGLESAGDEKLILVFPKEGSRKEMCQRFIDFIN